MMRMRSPEKRKTRIGRTQIFSNPCLSYPCFQNWRKSDLGV
jgi:hypothetical protein